MESALGPGKWCSINDARRCGTQCMDVKVSNSNGAPLAEGDSVVLKR
jgi:hypothetical protein